MDRIARMSAIERAELIRLAAEHSEGMPPEVIEKDFWVCWVLDRLFGSPEMARKILFKGGTSLSKVFGLIERFSEDVDLILDWREVTRGGPGGERGRSPSRTRSTRRCWPRRTSTCGTRSCRKCRRWSPACARP